MRVVLVTPRVGPNGGTDGISLHLAEGLARRGHEVLIFAGRLAAAPAGATAHQVPVLDERGPLGRIRAARTARRIAEEHGGVALALGRFPGLLVARLGGGADVACRIAVGRRSVSTEAWLDRQAARRAASVICNSQMAADQVHDHYGIAPERLRLVRNGVDLQRFFPDAGRRRVLRKRLGVTGRLVLFLAHGWRRKGLDVAIEAFARGAGPADRLLLGGDDARREGFLRHARRVLGERLLLLGPVAAPQDVLSGVDALLHPTRYDSAANVVLEALASGVPAITSGADGAKEVIPVPEHVVDNPEDVDGFAEALRLALDEDGVRSGVYRKAAEAWPVSRMVDGVEAVLSNQSQAIGG